GYSYYNFFNQYLLPDESMHMFLHCPDEAFCLENSVHFNQNALDWKEYFDGKPSIEDINLFIYKSTIGDFVTLHNIINGVSDKNLHNKKLLDNTAFKYLKKHKKENVLAYLVYAKKCENITLKPSYSWRQGEYYNEFEQYEPDFFNDIIKEGIELYKNEKDIYLKARYGFQLVRLAHYSFQYQEAVDFFDEYVESLKTKGYIYYRALEQKAGALRGLDRYVDANVDFIRVFKNLPDRRVVCLKSLYIDNQNTWNKVASKLTDQTVLNFVRAFKNGSELNEMEQILSIDPQSIYLDVLMLRYLNKIESARFSKSSYSNYNDFDMDKLEKFNRIIKEISNKRNEKDGLWVLAESYSNLFLNSFDSAKSALKKIPSSSKYFQQAQILDYIIRLEANKDSLSAEICNNFYVEYSKSAILKENEDIKAYLFKYFSNYYTSVGDKVAAGLCVNAYDFYSGRYSLINDNCIRQFELFFKKRNANELEKFLIKQAPDNLDEAFAEMRGTFYMQNNQLQKAYKEFKKLTKNFKLKYYNAETKVNYGYGNDGFALYDASIFSGAVRHYFNTSYLSVCDKTHLKFNFLQGGDIIQNKYDLVKMMILLEKKAEKKDANTGYYYYMLGNVWYNLGPEGWYKQILQVYYGENEPNNTTFFNYTAKFDVNIPINYYRLALEHAIDRELEAKIRFMMAKAVQYAENYPQLYYDSYQLLKNKYSDTQYYKDVIDECTYFDRYVNPDK
ncbi:MAG: hypothetical protein B6I20_09810, partial [Bacteroidetes bacterium 4572_117]